MVRKTGLSIKPSMAELCTLDFALLADAAVTLSSRDQSLCFLDGHGFRHSCHHERGCTQNMVVGERQKVRGTHEHHHETLEPRAPCPRLAVQRHQWQRCRQRDAARRWCSDWDARKEQGSGRVGWEMGSAGLPAEQRLDSRATRTCFARKGWAETDRGRASRSGHATSGYVDTSATWHCYRFLWIDIVCARQGERTRIKYEKILLLL